MTVEPKPVQSVNLGPPLEMLSPTRPALPTRNWENRSPQLQSAPSPTSQLALQKRRMDGVVLLFEGRHKDLLDQLREDEQK